MNHLSRSEELPPAKGVLYVERLKGSERGNYTVYSPKIEVIFSHWNGDKTVPCYEDHSLCPGGHSEESKRWRGYLHCWSHRMNRQVFLQLTAQACRELVGQVASGASLRGCSIQVYRTKEDKGRLHALIERFGKRTGEDLPPHRSAEESVMNLWGVYRPLGTPSHLTILDPGCIPEGQEVA